MREVEIIVNEDTEIVSVNDFFTFSVKYHNLSSTADTIPERERVIIHWSTTGIWLIDDNELLIEEDGSWRNVSKELSFFLEWQNPDSTHSPISLRMLFYAIVDSLKHDYWKTPFGAYQEHSIRISEIAQHYSRKAIRKEPKTIQDEQNGVISKKLKKDFINHAKNKLRPTPEERMKETPKPNNKTKNNFEAWDRLESLKAKGNTVPDPRQASIDRRENDEKATVAKAVDFTSPIVRKQFVSKQWLELPHIVKSLILLNYEDREGNVIPQYWDGTDYIQREIILQHC